MKAEHVEDEKDFKPVKMEFTFYSLEEVDAFYAVFNNSDIVNAIDQKHRGMAAEIRDAVQRAMSKQPDEIDIGKAHLTFSARLQRNSKKNYNPWFDEILDELESLG